MTPKIKLFSPNVTNLFSNSYTNEYKSRGGKYWHKTIFNMDKSHLNRHLHQKCYKVWSEEKVIELRIWSYSYFEATPLILKLSKNRDETRYF